MKKIGLIILACCAVAATKAQPVIKPQQYQILIETTVMHHNNQNCYQYARAGTVPNQCLYTIQTPFGDFCYFQDTTCSYNYVLVQEGPNSEADIKEMDELKLSILKGGNIAYTLNKNIGLDVPRGTTRKYYDTVNLYQSQFDITSIAAELKQAVVLHPMEMPQGSYLFYPMQKSQGGYSITPTGEFYNNSIHLSSMYIGRQFTTSTNVRVIPNLNSSLILPSHDRIKMQASNLSGTATWEYQDIFSETWHAIPSDRSSGPNKSILDVSGFDLFGNNYVDRLNTRVSFRVNAGGTYSSQIHYTLLLSSPHINSVIPVDLNCYERHEGSMKINFDRALLNGERLNIMLYDTAHRVNYSAFNIEQLAPDNSYTWKSELRAGSYMVSLLGKYATGIPYTITTDNRIDTVRNYIALNSVNFEDGFNTPEIDDFNAFADFGAYSEATYTGDIKHLAFQHLFQPDSIHFVANFNANVLCKGTASGRITLSAGGGKGNYKYRLFHEDTLYRNWTAFSSPTALTQIVSGLKAGTYKINVRDAVDCYMKNKNGEEKTVTFLITEPEKELTVDVFELSPITASGATNGKIRLQISGGSPFPTSGQEIIYPLPYNFEWRDSTTNQLITTHTTSFVNNKFESILDNLPHGTYIFRAFDRSYNANDPYNAGCVLELIIPVKEPQPLVVTIEKRRPISCNGASNGELAAIPSGGIPRDEVRYLFKWYRQTGEGNELLATTDSLIDSLSAGIYLVEITDKYNNTKLSNPFVLTQPDIIQLELSSTPASCYSSFDGTMSVVVTGGTPFADPNNAYLYEWSNGDRAALADTVAGGNYMVIVMDSMACIAKDTISITSPVRVIATHTIEPITCHDKNDGEIAVSVSGGVAPYTYEWNTGATTATISNLDSGRYWYTVKDANGCFDTDTIVLDQPDTLLLNLGADRVKCIDQKIRLDATVSTTQTLNYSWTGPLGIFATTPKVAITNPGTYHVAVSNSRGCVLRDTIEVTTIDSVINTDYVVSTQAYVNESVHLINISKPKTDSVKWIVPSLGNTIRVLQQNNSKCELIFADTGRYEVTMRAYFSSGCIEDSTKAIHVLRRDGNILGGQSNAFLKVYAVIYPNPNNGTFKVDLEFSEITSARLRLINTLNNVMIDDRQIVGAKDYLLDYNLGSGQVSGTYILVIDTAKGSFVYKVVIVQ